MVIVKLKKKEKNVKNQLGKLPIQKKGLLLTDVSMDYDATSFYPSAMWYEKTICYKIELEYAFAPRMNDELVRSWIFKHLHKVELSQEYWIITAQI